MLQKCYIHVLHLRENTFHFDYNDRYILYYYGSNFHKLWPLFNGEKVTPGTQSSKKKNGIIKWHTLFKRLPTPDL